MQAEAATLAGLIALSRYVAELLQEAGAPGQDLAIAQRAARAAIEALAMGGGL